MDAGSFQFVVFGLAAALVSNFSRSRVWRCIVLMLASIVFLGLLAQSPIVFLPLAGFLLLGYAGLVLLERGGSKSLIWSILAVLFAYVWLKKYTFLPLSSFLQFPYFTLGLSYIFFRVLHLLIETGQSGTSDRAPTCSTHSTLPPSFPAPSSATRNSPGISSQTRRSRWGHV
jgi:alginate O-acetyltransferase complex protein AlgI